MQPDATCLCYEKLQCFTYQITLCLSMVALDEFQRMDENAAYYYIIITERAACTDNKPASRLCNARTLCNIIFHHTASSNTQDTGRSCDHIHYAKPNVVLLYNCTT